MRSLTTNRKYIQTIRELQNRLPSQVDKDMHGQIRNAFLSRECKEYFDRLPSGASIEWRPCGSCIGLVSILRVGYDCTSDKKKLYIVYSSLNGKRCS